MEKDEEENETYEKVKQTLRAEMVDINDEDNQNECDEKLIQKMNT